MDPERKDTKAVECTADGQRIVERFVAELAATEARDGYLDYRQVSEFIVELAWRAGFKGSDPVVAVRHLEGRLGLHNVTIEVVKTAARELPRVPGIAAQAVGEKAVKLAASLTSQVSTSTHGSLESL